MSDLPVFAQRYPNLAEPGRGAAICEVSDEFFAPARRMLARAEPVFIADRFDEHGKWMDGWESRRKRGPGHDFCVIRICPGVIHGVEIDTRHFTGNYPPKVSLEACRVAGDPDSDTRWTTLLGQSVLAGDLRQFFAIENGAKWTHVRLNIFPDGGIARLRIYGAPENVTGVAGGREITDLSSAAAGGEALACNNMHFGHMRNLLSNTAVANMGDGWETRRRREPGNDWVVLRLGRAGRILRAEVDTSFFRGNYPARCSLKAVSRVGEGDLGRVSGSWPELLPPMALGPDQLHVFESQLRDLGEVSHVRLDIYPDGGVARLRLLGKPAAGAGA